MQNLSELIKQYLDFCKNMRGLDSKTIKAYKKDLIQFEEINSKHDSWCTKQVIEEYIKNKGADLVGSMESQGTTPRRLTDLIGSLCDLTSGSGDKGTPVVFIQGYFDNYASEE